MTLLAEQLNIGRRGQMHVHLGYPTWQAYLAAEVRVPLADLSLSTRRQVVAALTGEGMSTRAIASVGDVSHMTVSRDQAANAEAAADQVETPFPPDADEPVQTPPSVVGKDGKTYPKPKPKPKREVDNDVPPTGPESVAAFTRKAGAATRAVENVWLQVRGDYEPLHEYADMSDRQRDRMHEVVMLLGEAAETLASVHLELCRVENCRLCDQPGRVTMTSAERAVILRCLHPDTAASVSTEDRNEAFRIVNEANIVVTGDRDERAAS